MKMSRSLRLTIKYYATFSILVLFTFSIRPVLHLLEKHCGPFPFWVWDVEYPLCTLINIGCTVLWGYQTYQRITQRVQRRLFCAIAYFMAIWFTLSLAHYTFFSSDLPVISTISRYLWYLNYVPWMIIPLFFLMIACYIGKSDREKIDRRLLLLWIPYGLINLGILTNDLHQQAFLFPNGIANWKTDFTRGWLFVLAYFWIFIISVFSVSVIYRRTRVPHLRKYCILPLITLGIGQLLTLAAFHDIANLHVAECCILAFGITFELCIRINLIPNNVHYADLIRFPEFQVYIYDDAHQLSSKPDGAPDLPARQPPFMLDECHRVNSAEIFGGSVFWIEDEREVYRLRSELEEVRELLREESFLIQEENDLKKRKISVSFKRALFDSISAFSTPLVNQMETELDSLDPAADPKELAHLCIKMAYLKRRSNMVLKQQENGTLPLEELYNAVYEPFSYMEYLEIYAYVAGRLSGDADGDSILALYDEFYQCLSAVYRNLSAILVNFPVNNDMNKISLNMMMSLRENILPDRITDLMKLLNKIQSDSDMTLSYEEEERTIYLKLTRSIGGAV